MATGGSSTDALVGFAPPVPADVVDRAGAFARSGRAPVEPRRAASVVLLRDGEPAGASPAGVETYLLHRHARMPFAASVAAFPGGGLDVADGHDARAADPAVACALRETVEETTVRLDAGALVPWARWVTPAYEPRRYDTSFFLARVPAGQDARDVSGETDGAGWTTAAAALVDHHAGRLALMPPTWSILLELAAARDVADLLDRAAGRVIETVVPRLVRRGEGWAFAYEVAP